MSPADEHRLKLWEAEALSFERAAARTAAEREDNAQRAANLRRDIELLKSGGLRIGHP